MTVDVNYKLLLVLLIVMAGCRKPYTAPAINASNSYLVVEGVIDSGGDSTIIKLSRTVNLSSKTSINPQKGATVTVENDQNAVLTLKDNGDGTYVSAGLNIDNTRQYRLRIKTSDNREYLSAFVPVQITPPIDSVGYKIVNEGLLIYANTHDPTNTVQYYRWTYDDGWIFNADYLSQFVAQNGALTSRGLATQVYTCFGSGTSSDIVLAKTTNLKQAVVYQQPIATIPTTSEKLEEEYSILVKQYALTPQAYNFYSLLKTNTEQLGTIFDASPSEVPGNIQCISNPSEQVIGFVSVNNMQTKRIFVHKSQLPAKWTAQYPYACEVDTAHYDIFVLNKGSENQVQAFLIDSPQMYTALFELTGEWTYSTHECADCTVRGTRNPPAYWKY
jgi:hypothetical protein